MNFLFDFSSFSAPRVVKSNSKYVLTLRGRYAGTNVALKCHLIHTFENDVKHIVEQSSSAYDIEMCEHAIFKLPEHFFARHLGATVVNWRFAELLDSRAIESTEKIILDWCKSFPFESIDHFESGARLTMSVDWGEHSVYDHLARRTHKLELARFVAQMIVALKHMEKADVVHGNLRWENIMYPENDGVDQFFDLKHECWRRTIVNQHCVRMPNIIKITDWEDGFSFDVPEATQRQLFRAYHVSKATEIKKIYDKIGFLRLLHQYFPRTYLNPEEIISLEPLFSEYAYICPSTHEPLYEKTAVKMLDERVDAQKMILEVEKVLRRVYARAATDIIYHRINETSENFCLAVEGDNVDVIRQSFQYPFFFLLNSNCFYQAAVAATARFRNDVNPDFYGGVACVLNGDVKLGLQMMGVSVTLEQATSLEYLIRQRFFKTLTRTNEENRGESSYFFSKRATKAYKSDYKFS